MKKKYYNTPEVNIHQLMAKTAMLAGSRQEEAEYGGIGGQANLSKSYSLSFEVDEDEE